MISVPAPASPKLNKIAPAFASQAALPEWLTQQQ